MNEIKQVKLKVDDIEIEVPIGSTVLQAWKRLYRNQRFCYHEKLSVAEL